jgi:hypothetical protein
MKTFKITHLIFKKKSSVINENNAPDWLTSNNTRKGSTAGNRWFWKDYVLKLNIGESIDTTFRTITRLT